MRKRADAHAEVHGLLLVAMLTAMSLAITRAAAMPAEPQRAAWSEW